MNEFETSTWYGIIRGMLLPRQQSTPDSAVGFYFFSLALSTAFKTPLVRSQGARTGELGWGSIMHLERHARI